MWTVTYSSDPLCPSIRGEDGIRSEIATCTVDIKTFLADDSSSYDAFLEGGRVAEVALSDKLARSVAEIIVPSSSSKTISVEANCSHTMTIEPLYKMLSTVDPHRKLNAAARHHLKRSMTRKIGNGSKKSSNNTFPPYMFERTDVWCENGKLLVTLRIIVETEHSLTSIDESANNDDVDMSDAENDTTIEQAKDAFITHALDQVSGDALGGVLRHVATATFQDRLRAQLSSIEAVAFVADGSILPRRSGASSMPMASPPALPFKAPESRMRKEVSVEMGKLCNFLKLNKGASPSNGSTIVTVTGLVIPHGVTLIVGGGYHGKSTLLRCIASGVYDKIPGDGREFSVTVRSAVTVRAEDGRYVNSCNVSAFISNLPTPPGVSKTVDTTKFSTREASGSTSQASNVSEAIEMGASAMLVDEDVSAANFMARDGRMRSLVMDESITPLLYRVNGIYDSLGISTVVVVGGVGDWLDVPHQVVKLDKYLIYDATEKAQSVSRQFSHGHVQYAGRGVVHRLNWDKKGMPNQRRPVTDHPFHNARVSLMDGGGRICLTGEEGSEMSVDYENEDDDFGVIDMTRCEQLFGRSEQLYGCGLCVAWIIGHSKSHPNLGLRGLLDALDNELDRSGGMKGLLASLPESKEDVLECLGYASRPRRYEVAMALTRMRGICFDDIPYEDDGSEEEAARKAEERKKALADLWANRRKKAKET
mmetsp:Transcript_39532/g.81170  ORF Transcript_39532/g.81170 Transcript_39532/m.81170 type:complete len:706 (-) Transcript_39532:3090-5207(-)